MADEIVKSIPPLIAGVTHYPTWMENLPDLLKSLKCGARFMNPDPSKRDQFTGRSTCTQAGHKLHGTTPAKESDERYNSLCDAWAAADSKAAALVRGALDSSTKKAARLGIGVLSVLLEVVD